MWLTVKQWHQLLSERNITHDSSVPDSAPVLLPTRLEDKHPGVEFTVPYSLSRTFGLSTDQKSFLFKLLQSLHPTRERLFRLRKVNSSDCIHCQGIEYTTEHLLTCSKSTEVSSPLLACIRNYFPDISNQDIVILNIPTQESLDLPISWLLASCLSYIWKE